VNVKQRPRDLAGLRAARLPLLAEIDRLQQDARGQDEARAEIRTIVRGAAAETEARLRYSVHSGDFSQVLLLRARPDGYIDAGPLLAALIGPDRMADVLDRFAAELPPSVDHSARADRLAQARAELAAIEDAEEIEVLRLEALGQPPGRRPDADPAVVLKRREA